jgi:acid phosphatase (class A)
MKSISAKQHLGAKSFAQIAVLILCLTVPAFARDNYLPAGKPDGIPLLGPPPLPGSAEQAADLACAQAVFHARTPAEGTNAWISSKLTLFNFAPIIGPFFTPGKFPKLEALYANLRPEIKATTDKVKNHWQRQRPYQVDTNLWLGKPEASFSYPSGHSTVGTMQSLLLAEIFPDKKEAILAMGRQIGWDRVLIGKHFYTDVRAGRVLGQAIFSELMASPSFQRDLAEVKAEVQSTVHAKLESRNEVLPATQAR